uniref:SRCR domain-containing protein n=1 Tax=Cyprinus carpio TaxID=7962 RepID=A0A8C1YAU4_CYPCA
MILFYCNNFETVRLVGGNSPCSGRVEVHHDGQWGTVCDDNWDETDAAVVCREVGCGAAVEALGGASFGQGLGPIWMKIQCRGNESHIRRCPSSNSHKINCTHENDVGLICSGYTDLRLVNGSDSCSGRVELQFLNEWGTLCDACWDKRAASVLCRQLNCGVAVSAVGSDWFGEGSGEIWTDVFDCDGNETKLSECSISSWSRAELKCQIFHSDSSMALHDGLVRLSGERQCEGEVEVFIHQVWRRVLLDSWSLTESSVVCRQLGCALHKLSIAAPCPGSGPIWLDEVECEGNETSLWSCSSPGWGKHDCQHKEDVGVVCSGKHIF